MIAKERLRGVDTAIFYMDIRVCGKDYEQYYNRARELWVRFICYRVPSIAPEGDGDLRIEYFSAGGKNKRNFLIWWCCRQVSRSAPRPRSWRLV